MSNVPGPEYGLNEIVNALTSQLIETRNKDNKFNPIRPSSAGKCERELGYEMMEFRGHAKYEREQTSPSVHRLLNLGHHIERHVIDELYQAFKQSGKRIDIKYKQQVLSMYKLPDGSLLEGSMDLGIEMDGYKIAVDIKSKGDKYSSYFKSSWDEFCEKMVKSGYAVKFGEDAVFITDLEKFIDAEVDVFFNNNLYQLNKYLCSDFLRERGYNLGAILQSNKNDSRLREIRFEPNMALYNRVKDKFTKVITEVDTNKSVEGLRKDYTLGSSKCAFCSFRKDCWPENDALKAFFNELPAKQWPKDLDRLPGELQGQLVPLFEAFHSAQVQSDQLEEIERSIVKVLDNAKVYKIRLNESQIYRVKRLKSGGVAGKGQLVLRRDKV